MSQRPDISEVCVLWLTNLNEETSRVWLQRMRVSGIIERFTFLFNQCGVPRPLAELFWKTYWKLFALCTVLMLNLSLTISSIGSGLDTLALMWQNITECECSSPTLFCPPPLPLFSFLSLKWLKWVFNVLSFCEPCTFNLHRWGKGGEKWPQGPFQLWYIKV